MKQITVAILGCGNRGQSYAQLLLKQPEKFRIVAMCDPNPIQIENMKSLFSLTESKVFSDSDAFFCQKQADLLIVSTPDREHVKQAVKGLELGYDILLEKPISDSRQELSLLWETQQRTGKSVMVCHVLRYGPGYRKCSELLNAGVVGKLYAIDASERVAYWHWAQAYVRGVGALSATGHPTILAKCSHDLDLLQHYANSPCETVSSVGGLDFFIPANAPENAAERCVDCVHRDTCPYSAKRVYVDQWHQAGEPSFRFPFYRAATHNPITEEALYEGLRTGPFGRCAFRCPVDHADHQFVQMTFQNGIKASLKMVYAAKSGRRIVFYGTHGEIVFDEREDTITVLPFGGEKEEIRVRALIEGGHHHGGGDEMLVRELYEMLTGTREQITDLKKSLECHWMGIAAEESRALGGALVRVHPETDPA